MTSKILPLARKVEMMPSGLPSLCYSWDPKSKMAVQINYGMDGFVPTHWPPYYEHETHLIDEINTRLGVTPETRAEMELYSMNGEWPVVEDNIEKTMEMVAQHET